MNRFKVGATVALLSAALLAGCGRGETDSDSGADGLATGPGFDGTELTLGLLNVTAGPAASAFAPIGAGVEAYVAELNAAGGIDGKYPVKLVTRDTGYDPSKTAQAYEAIKRDVAAFAMVTGTAPVSAVMPLAERDDALVMAGTADGQFVHTPNVISVAMPIESLFLNGIDYAMNTYGEDVTVCAISTEGELAEAADRTLRFAESSMDVTVGPDLEVQEGVAPSTQVQQLKSAGCQAVVLNASVLPTVPEILSTAIQQDFEPTWLATAGAWGPVLNDGPLYDYMAENLIVVTEGVPWGAETPEMQRLMESHEAYTPDAAPAVGFLWGYNNMAAVAAILAQAVENGDVSPEGIVKASQGMDELTLPTYFNRPWGAPEERGMASEYCVLAPDKEAVGGSTEVDCPREVPDVVGTFEYPDPE